MSLMQQVVQQLLQNLVAGELLELAPGSTIADLEEEILNAISHAPGFSCFHPVSSETNIVVRPRSGTLRFR